MANLSDRVIEKVGAYLGQHAARASLNMFLEKNRLDAQALGREHLARADALVKEIETLSEVSP